MKNHLLKIRSMINEKIVAVKGNGKSFGSIFSAILIIAIIFNIYASIKVFKPLIQDIYIYFDTINIPLSTLSTEQMEYLIYNVILKNENKLLFLFFIFFTIIFYIALFFHLILFFFIIIEKIYNNNKKYTLNEKINIIKSIIFVLILLEIYTLLETCFFQNYSIYLLNIYNILTNKLFTLKIKILIMDNDHMNFNILLTSIFKIII
jgi:hypothetical protein